MHAPANITFHHARHFDSTQAVLIMQGIVIQVWDTGVLRIRQVDIQACAQYTVCLGLHQPSRQFQDR